MRTPPTILPALLAAAALGALAGPAAARAQVQIQIQIPLPPAPRLVVIQPGVEVVEGFDDEVFFSGRWFWAHRGQTWYRAREPRATFMAVSPEAVPPALLRLPPGHYRHYRAEERAQRREWRAQQRMERHREKDREKAERKAHKAHEKEERREHKDREHGHGEGRGRD